MKKKKIDTISEKYIFHLLMECERSGAEFLDVYGDCFSRYSVNGFLWFLLGSEFIDRTTFNSLSSCETLEGVFDNLFIGKNNKTYLKTIELLARFISYSDLYVNFLLESLEDRLGEISVNDNTYEHDCKMFDTISLASHYVLA